jgi:hypothetical protein
MESGFTTLRPFFAAFRLKPEATNLGEVPFRLKLEATNLGEVPFRLKLEATNLGEVPFRLKPGPLFESCGFRL